MPSVPASVVRLVNSLLPSVERCVKSVAKRVRRAQQDLRGDAVHRKAEGDFVTELDVEAEQALRRTLERLLPGAGFLGEETAPHELDSQWVWVVDPIDGTSNYSRGLPHFAVSVALLHRGAPVLATIHCAPENATYSAIAGRGAHRNGVRLRMPTPHRGDAAIYGCQWQRTQLDLGFLVGMQRLGGRIRTFGSTVTQLADVAAGRLDGNVQVQGRIWDIAAAGLLVEETGGRFLDWSGNRIFPFRDLTVGHTSSIGGHPSSVRRLLGALRPS